MPRITDARREARRAEIVAAARRCFARDGFHRTSMPDIAAEAGLSTGAFYRYFPAKDDVVLEIAGQAFGLMTGRIDEVAGRDEPPTIGDLVEAVVGVVGAGTVTGPAGDEIVVDELLRCGVQAWGELLRHDTLRARAATGFAGVRDRVTRALARGRAAGTVPASLDPGHGAAVVMALLPGFVLQRTAFGPVDADGFVEAVRTLTDRAHSPQ